MEPRTLLSGTTFSEQQLLIDTPSAYSPEVVTAADLDGDGDQDLLYAGKVAGKVAWYENSDGQGTFAAEHVVTWEAGYCQDVHAADLDGDGDLDILSAANSLSLAGSGIVAWYENLDGLGTFGPPLVLRRLAAASNRPSVRAADLDSDGDLDVVSSSINGVHVWLENTDGTGSFGPERQIGMGGRVRDLADLDGDGDVDVLSTASASGRDIRWYENTDGIGHFSPRSFGTSTNGVDDTRAADLDADGDLDVLFASSETDTIAWCENLDGLGRFGPQRVITLAGDGPKSVRAVDLDNDGDLDVLSSSIGPNRPSPGTFSIDWYENTDGTGRFSAAHVITRNVQGAWCADAADLDDDGDLDVISASIYDSKIAWYENLDARGTFGPQTVVVAEVSPSPIIPADIDGDGDSDLLVAELCAGVIAWYENIDGVGSFGERQLIARFDFYDGNTTCHGHSSTSTLWPINSADLDGDGDMDVVAWGMEGLVWYENTDGAGDFSLPRRIASPPSYLESLYVADIDDDGDLDVFFTDAADRVVAWHENLDGAGHFGPKRVIARTPSTASLVRGMPVDLDGDGDLEAVVLLQKWDDTTATLQWDAYENLDGQGTYGPPRTIGLLTEFYARSRFFSAADLDGDSDLDLVFEYRWLLEFAQVNAPAIQAIAWFENTDGAGHYGPLRVIAEIEDSSIWGLAVSDLDGDGDLDLLSEVDPYSSTSGIRWYENTDGRGTFRPEGAIVDEQAYFNAVADLDADGDIDIFAASVASVSPYGEGARGNLVWYENLLPHPGDANRDGRFDTADLVQVLAAGEYEDHIDDNSTWEEGDWDGDGDFTTSDLVLALQTGLYEVKSGLNVSKIAAAVDWLFAQNDGKSSRAFVA